MRGSLQSRAPWPFVLNQVPADHLAGCILVIETHFRRSWLPCAGTGSYRPGVPTANSDGDVSERAISCRNYACQGVREGQTEDTGGEDSMALKCSSCGAPATRDQMDCAFCQAALPKSHAPVIVQVVVDGVRSHIKETVTGLLIVGAVLLGYQLGRESLRNQSSNPVVEPSRTAPPPGAVESGAAEEKIVSSQEPVIEQVAEGEAKEGLSGKKVALRPVREKVALTQKPVIEQPVKKVKKSALFEFHTKRVSGSYTLIFGQFVNTGEVDLGKPSVTAIYVGRDGKELGHQKGYSELATVPPGGRAPIQIVLKDPPVGADIKFEADVRGWIDSRKPAVGLKLDSNPLQKVLGGWRASGVVTNTGSLPAAFAQVIAVGSDPAGKIISIGTGYASAQDPLEPGARARWEVPYLVTGEEPAKMEYLVQGWAK